MKDPVVRVVLAIGLVPLVWMGLYWIAMVPVNKRYQMLSRITETWNAAQACRQSVEEYYERVGRMPASEKDVVCSSGGRNVAPAKVASGVITISASGPLREALEDAESGIDLRLTPACGGPCAGAPIASWDCVTGTTIERRYRPAICR